MERSSYIRPDRGMAALEDYQLDQLQTMWDSNERPPDPMAWRIRTLMEKHLSPNHYAVLEAKYFLNKSTGEIARERGCTERAVRGMLERARSNLLKVIAKYGDQVSEVPDEEL